MVTKQSFITAKYKGFLPENITLIKTNSHFRSIIQKELLSYTLKVREITYILCQRSLCQKLLDEQ
jgi:hypothetical protein